MASIQPGLARLHRGSRWNTPAARFESLSHGRTGIRPDRSRWARSASREGGLESGGEATVDLELQRRFEKLAAEWREDTEFDSAPSALFMHPAYQEIIGFGPAVLPLLFRDLEETGSFWFWALRSITGENPIPQADRGDIPRVAEHWLNWGREKGYLDG